MATTINANTSTGFIATSDTSGVLQLQTGGTTAVSIGTDQSFNFSATGQRITGDFSNATIANRVMFQNSVTNATTNIQALPNGTSVVSGLVAFANSDPTNTSFAGFQSVGTEVRASGGITGTGSYPYMTFYTGGSERVRIDTSGNVGIGITNPGAKLAVVSGTSPNIATLQIGFSGSNNYYDANLHSFRNGSQTEVARIDSSGNLLVGTTSAVASSKAVIVSLSGGNSLGCWSQSTSGNNGFITFGTEATYTERGYIYYDRTAGQTKLSATSDYRAKDITGKTTNALTKVLALQVHDAKLKWAEGNTYPMFIAHELQEVAPWAVSGEKDAVDEDGNPKYQSVSADSLVATLTAAIQELKALVDTQASTITSLTDRITALEGTTP